MRTVSAGAWRDGASLSGDQADLDLRLVRRGDERLMRIAWEPRRLGSLIRTIEVWDDEGPAARLDIRGTARAPLIEVVPEIVDLGTLATGRASWIPLWVWSETGRPVAFGGLPVCGEESLCIRGADGRMRPDQSAGARGGLPQALSVRAAPMNGGVVEGTILLSACDEPACTVEVPVRGRAIDGEPACTPSVLSFGAVAEGAIVDRRLTCAGVDLQRARWDLEEIALVDSSSASVLLRFHGAGAPGVARGTLEVADVSVPLLAQVVDAPPCDLDVGPDPLVFGPGSVGAEVEGYVRFVQRGERTCLLGEASATPEAAFSLPPPGVPAHWLEPGAVDELPVRFHPPRPGQYSGALATNAPEHLEVRLEGFGVEGEARVRPRAIDFGVISSCVGRSASLLVENVGAGAVVLGEATFSGRDPDAFALPEALPVRIGGGEAMVFSPRVAPSASGTVSADLILSLETASSQARIPVSLRAVVAESLEVVDEFQQLEPPKLDLLLVVDPDLGSAEPRVRSNLEALADFIEHQGTWTRVAMTTPEVGAPLLGPRGSEIVTATAASDLAAELSSRVSVSTATTPSEGLAAALTVLTTTVGAAGRFLRPDAYLSVVVTSPREDQSAGEPDAYVNDLLAIKGFRNTNRFSFSAVVGEAPNGCTIGEVLAEPGARYIEVASRTGGVFESFCSADWARSLMNFSTTTFGFKTRFFLTNVPVPDTIEVEVEGEEVPSVGQSGTIYWAYDVATNSVNFSPLRVPPPGAHLTVRYLVECP